MPGDTVVQRARKHSVCGAADSRGPQAEEYLAYAYRVQTRLDREMDMGRLESAAPDLRATAVDARTRSDIAGSGMRFGRVLVSFRARPNETRFKTIKS